MANSLYIRPEMRNHDDELRRAVDEAFHDNLRRSIDEVFHEELRRDIDEVFVKTPELEAKPFTRIKRIEGSIYGLRTCGTKDTIPRSFMERVSELLLRNPHPLPLEDRLVEYESKRGGELFPKLPNVESQRFWFHGGDWYYENTLVNEAPAVARYQFSESGMHKLGHGVEIAFDYGEADTLIRKIDEYYEMTKDIYGPHDEYDLVA